MPTFSPNLEHTLHRAVGEANLRKHEFATLEHLLFGLLDDKDAVAVLRACDVNVRQLRAEIKSYLDLELENIKTEQGGEATPTSGFQRVIQRAILHVQSSGREEVTGANVLIALFSERESHATYFLQQYDMTRLDAVSYVSHGLAKSAGKAGREDSPPDEGDDFEEEDREETALEKYCVDLNQKAKDGKIDRLIMRWNEPYRSCAGDQRTTRFMWVIRAWAKRLLPRAWPFISLKKKYRKFCSMPLFSVWIWEPFLREPVTGVILKKRTGKKPRWRNIALT